MTIDGSGDDKITVQGLDGACSFEDPDGGSVGAESDDEAEDDDASDAAEEAASDDEGR